MTAPRTVSKCYHCGETKLFVNYLDHVQRGDCLAGYGCYNCQRNFGVNPIYHAIAVDTEKEKELNRKLRETTVISPVILLSKLEEKLRNETSGSIYAVKDSRRGKNVPLHFLPKKEEAYITKCVDGQETMDFNEKLDIFHCGTFTMERMHANFFFSQWTGEDDTGECFVGVVRDVFALESCSASGFLPYTDRFNYAVGRSRGSRVDVLLLMENGVWLECDLAPSYQSWIKVQKGRVVACLSSDDCAWREGKECQGQHTLLQPGIVLMNARTGGFSLYALEPSVVIVGRYSNVVVAKDHFATAPFSEMDGPALFTWLKRFCEISVLRQYEWKLTAGWIENFLAPSLHAVMDRTLELVAQGMIDAPLGEKIRDLVDEARAESFGQVVSNGKRELGLNTPMAELLVQYKDAPAAAEYFRDHPTTMEIEPASTEPKVSVKEPSDDSRFNERFEAVTEMDIDAQGNANEKPDERPMGRADVASEMTKDPEAVNDDATMNEVVSGTDSEEPDIWFVHLQKRMEALLGRMSVEDRNNAQTGALKYVKLKTSVDFANSDYGIYTGSNVADTNCECAASLDQFEIPLYAETCTNRQCTTYDLGVVCNPNCTTLSFPFNAEKRRRFCRNNILVHPSDGCKVKAVPKGEKGMGLVADEGIPKGRKIVEYIGEVITVAEFQRRNALRKDNRMYFARLNGSHYVDATAGGNLSRFANHSCADFENCRMERVAIFKNVEKGDDVIEVPEEHIVLVATKDIPYGTEITYTYNRDDVPLEGECLCDKFGGASHSFGSRFLAFE